MASSLNITSNPNALIWSVIQLWAIGGPSIMPPRALPVTSLHAVNRRLLTQIIIQRIILPLVRGNPACRHRYPDRRQDADRIQLVASRRVGIRDLMTKSKTPERRNRRPSRKPHRRCTRRAAMSCPALQEIETILLWHTARHQETFAPPRPARLPRPPRPQTFRCHSRQFRSPHPQRGYPTLRRWDVCCAVDRRACKH